MKYLKCIIKWENFKVDEVYFISNNNIVSKTINLNSEPNHFMGLSNGDVLSYFREITKEEYLKEKEIPLNILDFLIDLMENINNFRDSNELIALEIFKNYKNIENENTIQA